MPLSLSVVVIAFVCEYADSVLGMGYGTILTPVLLLLGYHPLQIVPAVLLSEFMTGFIAAVAHQRVGTVNLQRGTRAFNIAMLLALASLGGTLFGVGVAVNISERSMRMYTAVVAATVGLTIVVLALRRQTLGFSWLRVGLLGLLAAFNKGISGGGYGVLATGGQILSGVEPKSAIAISALSEGISSIAGAMGYALLGDEVDWSLVPSLGLGALASVPLAALTLSRASAQRVMASVGLATMMLGLWLLTHA